MPPTPAPPSMFGTDTHGRILRGTAQAATRHGVRDITVQHILDAAGVSRRTFYKTFKGVEDALDALFELSTQMLVGTIHMSVSGEKEPLARLLKGVDAYLELQRVGGRLIMELQAEAIRPDSPLAPRRDKLLDAMIEVFARDVTRILGHPIDPLIVRAMLLSVEGMVLHLQRSGPLTDEDIDRIRKVYVPVLLRVLGQDVELPV